MKHFTITWFLIVIANVLSAQITSGLIKIGKLELHYETTGKGQPVIFLHAGLQDSKMWKQQMDAFAKTNQVIVFDLPAHGQTKGSDTTVFMPEIISAVMDRLNVTKASIVGLSFGAVCAVDFALTHPDKVSKLVLAAPGLLAWDKVVKMDSLSQAKLDSMGKIFAGDDAEAKAKSFTHVWCDGPYRKPVEIDQNVRSYVYETTLKNLQAHQKDTWPRFVHTSAAEEVKSISNETLIIYGDKDLPLIETVCKFLNTDIRHSELKVISGAAHMINLEASTEFNHVVRQFLNR